jgi:hypothetical protein
MSFLLCKPAEKDSSALLRLFASLSEIQWFQPFKMFQSFQP